MFLVTFLKCHSLSLPSRIPSSLIRGKFGVVMDVFGGCYYFSVLWIFSAQAEQCFLRLLDVWSTQRVVPLHHIVLIILRKLQVAFCFIPVQRDTIHLVTQSTRGKAREGKWGGEGGEWIYSTCLSPQVDYACHSHWNVTQHSTNVKQFNRW